MAGGQKGGLIAACVTAHVPRMAYEDKAPEFQKELIAGSKAMGAALRTLEPDLLVIKSAHWVCSFNWYVTAHAVHKGHCVADEAPDLIPGEPYERRGDPEFAQALVARLREKGFPAGANESPHYEWDYAGIVPLLYLDPDSTIPVVEMPTCLAADLEESMAAGRAVHEAARRTGRRAVFLASTALSHKIVRGPHLWPTEERVAMDRRLIGHLERGEIAELRAWLPDYSRGSVAEMGGRVVAGLVGALDAMRADGMTLAGRQYGAYAQSSGSGNVNIAVRPVQ